MIEKAALIALGFILGWVVRHTPALEDSQQISDWHTKGRRYELAKEGKI